MSDGDLSQATTGSEVAVSELVGDQAVKDRSHEGDRLSAERLVDAIVGIDLADGPGRARVRHAIELLGCDAAPLPASNGRLAPSALRDLAERGAQGGELANDLSEIATRMRRLDPSKVDFTRHGMLGRLRDPVRRYLGQLRSARDEISSVMVRLKRCRDTLAADIIELERQEAALLEEARYLAGEIDTAGRLESALAVALDQERAAGASPGRLRLLSQEMLLPLERRREDMQALLAVDQQEIAVLSVLRENNRTLIASVDQTSRAALWALDTGVMALRGLGDRQGQAGCMGVEDESSGPVAKDDSGASSSRSTEERRQTPATRIDPRVIGESFGQVFAALEEGDAFRKAAIPKAQAMIDDLQDITEYERHHRG